MVDSRIRSMFYTTLVVITMFSVRFIFVPINVGYITLVVMQMVLLFSNL